MGLFYSLTSHPLFVVYIGQTMYRICLLSLGGFDKVEKYEFSMQYHVSIFIPFYFVEMESEICLFIFVDSAFVSSSIELPSLFETSTFFS